MKIRLAGEIKDSIVNGDGIRYVLFSQGCNHNCPGCFNPETHSFDGGEVFDTKDIIEKINNDFIIDGVTFSGGDPFEQPLPFIEIAKSIDRERLDIWCYTGYTLDEILKSGDKNKQKLLNNIDVLVDGKFDINNITNIAYKGSNNQNIIRMTCKEI